MSATTTADPFSPAGAMAPPGATRPSWSGLLQLSLVGIPLKAYPAVRTREVTHFHQLNANCGQRIRYAKQCPVHGPVDIAAIVKGYEYGPDQHLVIEPEDTAMVNGDDAAPAGLVGLTAKEMLRSCRWLCTQFKPSRRWRSA